MYMTLVIGVVTKHSPLATNQFLMRGQLYQYITCQQIFCFLVISWSVVHVIMLKSLQQRQLRNSRKSVILTNLLRKMQEILVLTWMKDIYFQIDLGLNNSA